MLLKHLSSKLYYLGIVLNYMASCEFPITTRKKLETIHHGMSQTRFSLELTCQKRPDT